MAYICNKNINCKDCPHYRYDDDYEGMCCWAQYDEKNKEINEEGN